MSVRFQQGLVLPPPGSYSQNLLKTMNNGALSGTPTVWAEKELQLNTAGYSHTTELYVSETGPLASSLFICWRDVLYA